MEMEEDELGEEGERQHSNPEAVAAAAACGGGNMGMAARGGST